MAKISVIVPVYNVQDYVEECIESIRHQTWKDLEILCIDDGSTDKSGQILDVYAQKDKRIKVIHKKNTGYGHTMNIGLDEAGGEYIGIVESDDFIEENMYEELYKIARRSDLDFVKSNHWKYSNEGRVLDTGIALCRCNAVFSRYENMEKVFAARSIWTGIYKKKFLMENQIRFLETPGASYQDNSFAFKVSVTARNGYFSDAAYVNYRVDNNSSSVKSKNKIFCVCDEMAECWRYLLESDLDIRRIYPYYLINKKYIYIWNMKRLMPESRKEFARRVRKELREDLNHPFMSLCDLPAEGGGDVYIFFRYPEGYYRYINQEFSIVTLESKDACFRQLKQEDSLYIYGAGIVGNRLKSYIADNGMTSAVEYVVTEKNEKDLENVSEITSKKLDITKMIVIAVANGNARNEMTIQALDREFERVFVLDDAVVKYLKEEQTCTEV